ncbi:hypothetical protein SRHO_G00152270 [Serrasalmus rhombeus]
MFELLPSGRRYRHLKTRTNRLRDSFYNKDFMDFRRNPPFLPSLNINGSVVSTIESLKFLGTTRSRDLQQERNMVSIAKRAQQRKFS